MEKTDNKNWREDMYFLKINFAPFSKQIRAQNSEWCTELYEYNWIWNICSLVLYLKLLFFSLFKIEMDVI